MPDEKKRTTLYLGSDLLKELKIRAAMEGHSVSGIVEDLVRDYLRRKR